MGGVAIEEYPGLGCQLEGSLLQVDRFGHSMGKYSSVFAEGDGVSIHSRVNLYSDGLCTLLGCQLQHGVECYITVCGSICQQGPSLGIVEVTLLNCRGAGVSSILPWLLGVKLHLLLWGEW